MTTTSKCQWVTSASEGHACETEVIGDDDYCYYHQVIWEELQYANADLTNDCQICVDDGTKHSKSMCTAKASR